MKKQDLIFIADCETSYINEEQLSLSENKRERYADGIYILYFSREDTAQMQPIAGNYDLTVVFTNDKPKTIVKNAPIRVIGKNNKVDYNG